jgi:hypothetical protein
MKLIGDTGGKWPRVQDSLAQDLATIQRQFNLLQQTVASQASLITALQAKVANGNLAIAPNMNVNNLAQAKGLQTVSHDGTMTGLGTAGKPLSVNPAYVLGLVSSSPILLATLTVSSKATFTGMGATYAAGSTIVPAVTNKHILPLVWGVNWVETGNNAFNPWTAVGSFRIGNNAAGNAAASDLAGFANSAFDGDEGGCAFGSGRNWSANVGTNTPRSAALKIWTISTWTANGSSSMAMTGAFFVLYSLISM